MTKLLATAAFLTFILQPAFAGISQTAAVNFNNASVLMTTPRQIAGGGGFYLLLVYGTQNSRSAACGVSGITSTLTWTDERGNVNTQSITTPNSLTASGTHAYMVVPVHTGSSGAYLTTSGTIPPGADSCVSTKGTGAGVYSIYATGLGMWAGQPQKQLGLTEQKFDNSNVTSGVQYDLSYVNASATYMVAVMTNNISGTTLSWADEYGPQSNTFAADAADLIPLRLAYSSTAKITVAAGTTGSGNRFAAAAIKFGTPGNGGGPLVDMERVEPDFTFTFPNGQGIDIAGVTGIPTSHTFFLSVDMVSSASGTGNVQTVITSYPDEGSFQDCTLTLGVSTGTGTGAPFYGTKICPETADQLSSYHTFISYHSGLPTALDYDQFDAVIGF